MGGFKDIGALAALAALAHSRKALADTCWVMSLHCTNM